MNNTIQTDILICGAGPSGMFLALLLKRFGLNPVIIEKLTEPSQHTKAGTLQPRTMEILSEFGLKSALLRKGKIVYQNNFYSNLHKISALDYSQLQTEFNYLLSISQPEIELILFKALEEAGIKIYRGFDLLDIQTDEGSDKAIVKNIKDGNLINIHFSYLVGADGGRSKVRSLLLERGNLKTVMQTRYKTSFIMGDFRFKNFPFKDGERHTFFKGKHLLVFIPMPDSITRIVALRHVEADPNRPVTEEDFQEIIRIFFGHNLETLSCDWLSAFTPSRFMADSFMHNNIILVGDAAHIMSPIGAQGINVALEDCYNLGWKLGMACKREIEESFLQSYSLERSQVAKEILSQTHINQRFISNYIGNFILRLKLKALKSSKDNLKLAMKQTLFNVRYANGLHSSLPPGNTKEYIKAGDKFDVSMIKESHQNECELTDLMPYESFHLIVNLLSKEFEYKNIQQFLDSELQLFNKAKILILKPAEINLENINCPNVVIQENSPFARKLSLSNALFLVRPDKFVLANFSLRDRELVRAKFDSILSTHSRSITQEILQCQQ